MSVSLVFSIRAGESGVAGGEWREKKGEEQFEHSMTQRAMDYL